MSYGFLWNPQIQKFNGSPLLRHFFERNWVARSLNDFCFFFNLALIFNYFVRVAVGIVLYLFLEFDQKSISGSYEIVFVQKMYNVW